jgi:hypothetical protein
MRLNLSYFSQGQENKPFTETDNDSGKGTMTSYGSSTSLNSTNSSSHAPNKIDSPEQFEVLKLQKETMENGIDMYVIICMVWSLLYMYVISGAS